ncbi:MULTISPECIES: hypothetical protein [unclassified Nostoc]|uniref:hypothetical protein n=1 Tax=unclassified Nostoc TaxID=2593658 RepID=UPI0013D2F81D|nr:MULTISPECIES: hypothetical protein [unclassified Nostoc]MBE9000364.1 hypothetical protein [Nostoc sp. LEGE 12447]NEU82430.1 hypothetical protein [Nostoc sp. UIC 10630]
MGHREKAREQGAGRVWEAEEQELLIINQYPMPNDGSCSTWGNPKTALPPQCPIPNAQYPIPINQ